MLIEDKKHLENVAALVTDPDGQRELLQQDEEEDFLDEGMTIISIQMNRKLIAIKFNFNCNFYSQYSSAWKAHWCGLPSSAKISCLRSSIWSDGFLTRNVSEFAEVMSLIAKGKRTLGQSIQVRFHIEMHEDLFGK